MWARSPTRSRPRAVDACRDPAGLRTAVQVSRLDPHAKMTEMQSLYYDDPLEPPIPRSIFLAGPTARGARTAWRLEALAILEARGLAGTVILPEFRDGTFEARVPARFGAPASPTPGMRATSFNILVWETTGIENATVVLFWMPFAIGAGPDSLPGFTTRAEVSRELAR